MKIAQVAPLYVRVPPRWYGGTERVVSWIIEGLAARGHDVTLFASGDSETPAKLVAPCRKALWLEKEICVPEVFHAIEFDLVRRMAAEFDVIHSHLDFWLLPFRSHCPTPTVTTLHGRTDLPELQQLYNHFNDCSLVSISAAQQKFLPQADWIGTVWHGMPDLEYGYTSTGGDYLAFLGRMSPEKGVDAAIETARRTGMPLKIAARIPNFKPHFEWYREKVEPLLATVPNVEYIGEANDAEKYELLRNAAALIAPVDWPEPFGLMFIEAWAVGTPVIARPYGSVPELVRHGEVGFVADSIEDLVRAVGRIDEIDRAECLRYFKENFTIPRMVEKYERIYELVIARQRLRAPVFQAAPLPVPLLAAGAAAGAPFASGATAAGARLACVAEGNGHDNPGEAPEHCGGLPIYAEGPPCRSDETPGTAGEGRRPPRCRHCWEKSSKKKPRRKRST